MIYLQYKCLLPRETKNYNWTKFPWCSQLFTSWQCHQCPHGPIWGNQSRAPFPRLSSRAGNSPIVHTCMYIYIYINVCVDATTPMRSTCTHSCDVQPSWPKGVRDIWRTPSHASSVRNPLGRSTLLVRRSSGSQGDFIDASLSLYVYIHIKT